MILSNIISKAKEVTNGENKEVEDEFRAKIGFKFFDFFNTGIEGNGKTKGSDSKKVLETFEIKTTKSVILSEVVERSNNVSSFNNINEGELVMINDVNLTLENEPELRTVKLFTSGAFKDMAIPGANGFDITNLFNSMFKDYAYKIKGTTSNTSEKIYNPKNEKSALEKRKRKVRPGRRKNENGKFPDTHTKKRQRLNVNKTVFKRCLFMQKNTQKVIVNSEEICIFT